MVHSQGRSGRRGAPALLCWSREVVRSTFRPLHLSRPVLLLSFLVDVAPFFQSPGPLLSKQASNYPYPSLATSNPRLSRPQPKQPARKRGKVA